MEEQDVLNEVSGDHSMNNQGTIDNHLPEYLAYLSLGFKVIFTVIIELMAGWIIVTIKTTRHLHNNNNIYVANLMVADGMRSMIVTSLSVIITISYFIGVKDFISCNVYFFLHFPSFTIQLTILMNSIDKVIAIAFPLRHSNIMKPQVVFGIISATWVLVIMLYVQHLFSSKGFNKMAEFGTCHPTDNNRPVMLLTVGLPLFINYVLLCFLNIYLTIKAYKIHKQIEEESKLSGGHSGDNNQLKALKKKQANIKKHLKPMITLLVIILASLFVGLLLPLLYVPTAFLESSTVYKKVLRHVLAPNMGYVSFLLYPLVYGLYFKQIRKPMINLLKRITCPCKCKSAAVAPLPQRSRIMWM